MKTFLTFILVAASVAFAEAVNQHGVNPQGRHFNYEIAQAPAVQPAPSGDGAYDKEDPEEDDPIWVQYNKRHENDPPEEIAARVSDKIVVDPKNPPLVIDVGAGGGKDAKHFLKKGMRVLAVDMTKESMKRLQAFGDEKYKGKLETQVEWMQDMKLPKASADLVNSSFTLPFVPKDVLEKEVMPKIKEALKPEGKFTAQFFGEKHVWAGDREMNFFSKAELGEFLSKAGFNVEEIVPREWDQQREVNGKTVKEHWEVYDVIATPKESTSK